MKYISKRVQSYLSESDIVSYNYLKAQRVKIRKEWIDRMQEKLKSKDSSGIDPVMINSSRKISKINNLINDIEFKGYENAESKLCIPGNVICCISSDDYKIIVSSKKNRDYYTCIPVNNLSSPRDIHWKTIAQFYNLDEISK